MNRWKWTVASLGLAAWFGCQQEPPVEVESVPVEANDLGVVELSIERGTDNGNQFVTIHGLNAAGEELATATVDTGQIDFRYFDEAPAERVPGTDLTIAWLPLEVTADYSVPDNYSRQIRESVVPTIRDFAQLQAVATAIERASGLTFEARLDPPPALAAETPYTTSCTSSMFPSSMDSCCQGVIEGDGTVYSVSRTSSTIYHRQYGNPCTNENGSTGCGQGGSGPCFYGPCGAWTYGTTGASNPIVFHPTAAWPSDSNICGWDVNAGAASTSWPRDYISGESTYPSLSASCPYTVCYPDGSRG